MRSLVVVGVCGLVACSHAPAGNGHVTVSTIAGNGTKGYVDGPNGNAELDHPFALAFGPDGTLFVVDAENHCIRTVASGETHTLAGNGHPGFVDGPSLTAQFNGPAGVAVDNIGRCFVSDADNNRIRMISGGNVSTLAGNGVPGSTDGTGGPSGTAESARPAMMVLSGTNLYVAQAIEPAVRLVAISDGATSTLTGNGARGWVDGTGGRFGTTEFNLLLGIALDAAGNAYVTDGLNDNVRRVDPLGNTTTLAGNGTMGFADGSGGRTGSAEFSGPLGIAVGPDGTIYVGDSGNNRIRAIAPNGDTTTLAGTGTAGYADGDANLAEFSGPSGLAFDAAGDLYVADQQNQRIREITFH